MTQEQYSTTQRNNIQTSENQYVYKVGIYGWRKRCLYFFVLLLMILLLVNLALTIWILKVMNFTTDGMGNLRITDKGLRLEGPSEFLETLYAKEIRSKADRSLYLQSSKNVTVSVRNEQNEIVTQLITGSEAVEAHGKRFEVNSNTGKLLFSAEEGEVVVGAERLRVLGAEGAVFDSSLETPHIRAEPFKQLRLESPTRSLIMEAPKGVEIDAEAGDLKALCRNELKLESEDGEIILDARNIKLPRLPKGTYTPSATGRQNVFEVCVCPNGRLFLSQSGTGSTCQINNSICL
ncbi:delta-sarcoglycan [Callorhinchus milii]|uniref:Delta-sarcoglycan-like protein n=1 Tax=Callorhinchus milii TaxID=7868 RepID=V9L993_CALMI|nr:delta-sarcoglycan [Callorhinchus milii]|eukprot:gi/632948538/ref/XP_007889652.1/ PREDICTED: delta-sarcoglycan [Callorhinchus milii]